MGLFDAIDIAGSGLTAERVRMDVTSENLANAQTTKTATGGPYQRQEVLLQQVPGGQGSFAGTLAGAMQQPAGTEGIANPVQPGEGALEQGASSTGGPAGGVAVAGIVNDTTPDKLVYDPGNPEADAKGYVKMPNVDTVTEMVDLISESRTYQSDVTAMQTAKSMFNATLTLLK